MKIPVRRVELKDIGYPEYWFEAPKSVTEGWLGALRSMPDGPDKGRRSNVTMLALVTAWNFDDGQGRPLPLVTSIDDVVKAKTLLKDLSPKELEPAPPEAPSKEGAKAKARTDEELIFAAHRAILAEIPVDVVLYMVQQIVQRASELPNRVLDF